MSDSFGARLRLERERRQIPLTAIAARTKIKLSLFEAIERDSVSGWPSGIFRRSFMRAYAEAVGLDAEAIVAEFLELFPEQTDAADPLAVTTHTKPVAALPEPSVPGMRVTIADTAEPYRGGRLLAGIAPRITAIVWDAGLLIAVSASCFLVMGVFWKPLAVTALCYYLISILLLGNTPGVCLLAPRATESGRTPEEDTLEEQPAASAGWAGVFGRLSAPAQHNRRHDDNRHGYDWRAESRHV
jgi:hypothetical protein